MVICNVFFRDIYENSVLKNNHLTLFCTCVCACVWGGGGGGGEKFASPRCFICTGQKPLGVRKLKLWNFSY